MFQNFVCQLWQHRIFLEVYQFVYYVYITNELNELKDAATKYIKDLADKMIEFQHEKTV
jgi:hypothetical protein